MLFPRVAGRNDDVSAIAGDIHVRRLAERDDTVSDRLLLRIRFVIVGPFRAGTGTVPFVRGKLIDDRRLLGARGECRLCITLVEAIDELVDWNHYVGRVGSGE